MHPEIRETAPGACSKCGMALETEVPPALHQTEYTCPMHPEVVQAETGAWPYSHRKNLGCCNRKAQQFRDELAHLRSTGATARTTRTIRQAKLCRLRAMQRNRRDVRYATLLKPSCRVPDCG